MPGPNRRSRRLKQATELSDISQFSSVNPQEGDLLIFDPVDGVYENGKDLTGDYTFTGAQSITGALTVSDDITIGDALTVSGNANLNADLAVIGATSLNSSLSVGTTLSVTGAATLSDDLSVAGATSVAGFSVSGDATFAQDVTITGTATIGTLSLTDLALTGDLTADNGLFAGNLGADSISATNSISGNLVSGANVSALNEVSAPQLVAGDMFLTSNEIDIGGTSGTLTVNLDDSLDAEVAVMILSADDVQNFSATVGGILFPAGTTAQRPSVPSNGTIRYNTTDNAFEQYANSTWSALGGGAGLTNWIDVGLGGEGLYNASTAIATQPYGIDIVSEAGLYAGISGQLVDGTQDWQIGRTAAGDVDLTATATSTNVSIRTTVTTNGDHTHLRALAGGATQLFFDNNVSLETNANGINVNDPSANSPLLIFDAAGAEVARIQRFSDGNLYMDNRTTAGDMVFRVTNTTTSDRTVLRLNRAAGELEGYYGGSLAFETATQGIRVIDANGNDDPFIRFYNSANTTELGVIGLFNGTYFINNETVSGIIRMKGQDAGDVDTVMAELDPDGSVDQYFSGTLATSTTADGFDVFSTGGAGSNAILGIIDGDSEQTFLRKRGDTGGFEIRNQEHGGSVFIQAEDSGGVARNMIVGDPDGPVDLYYAGSQKAETINEGFRVNEILHTPTDTELTISAGAITVTRSYHSVDTEADAATDDLDTINGGAEGAIIVLRANNSARTVVVKDNTGNLRLAGDFSMDNILDTITLFKATGSTWFELSRSDNGA